MINWLKKNPLLHGLFLALIAIFAGLLIIGGFFVYAFNRMNDPNYIEFGPFISFYQSRECATQSNDTCQSFGGQAATDIFKNNPPTLANSLKGLIKVRAQNYPQDPNLWQCQVNGRIIEDNNEKLIIQDQGQTFYKCWPK